MIKTYHDTLRKKCSYSVFFFSAFSRMRIEYEDLLCKSPYSVRMWEIEDQKIFECGHSLRKESKLEMRNVL